MNRILGPFHKVLNRWQPHAIILIYHRISDLSSDPQLLSVSPDLFEEQIRHLVEHYNPVALGDLPGIIKKKEIPEGTIAITFDDGYADNLWNAKPILEKYSVPATVFVTTGYLDTDREFWWDNLERMILLPEKLPNTLSLTINDRTYLWKDLDASQPPEFQFYHDNKNPRLKIKSERWDVTQGSYPGPKYQLYSDLHRLIRSLDTKERESVISRIESWSGVPSEGRPGYRALDSDDLCELNREGLIAIGSHTITHPALKYESGEDQMREILESKRTLETILQHDVTSFSYPFGGKGDFSKETENFVKYAGYTVACANYCGLVTRWTDQYRLPRYLVRNWGSGIFAQKMSEWFNG